MATRFHNIPNLLCFFYLLSVLRHANSLSFKISRFDPGMSNILYQGDAKPDVGTIEFNIVNYINRVGWATYAERVLLWDSETGKIADFSSRFSFLVNTRNLSLYGHGICFFLAPVRFQIPPNSAGGFLGLFNTTTSDSPRNQIVSVEFDSFENPEWDPPGIGGHVGINNNSISSAVYTQWNASNHSKDTANVLITYNSTTKNLSVSWSYFQTNDPREKSSLSFQIDLSKVLPESVMVGFSAATGMYVERHILQSWEFHSSLERRESKQGKITGRRTKIVLGSVVPITVLVIGTVMSFIFWWLRKQRKTEPAETRTIGSINDDEFEKGAGPRRFSFKDLVYATNNFSERRKLGEGGFGAVYKGYLIDVDIPIAVKRISRRSKQGKKEYSTEVQVISQLRHRNLVQLIGWCHDKSDFMLVYEFMPNGSLDSHLFGQRIPLTWPVRYKISLGLASAIFYLHEECEQCVVHRDIKSSNVMLDSSFNVKLGDFGLARLMSHELGPKTTGLAGTLGYLAPEYISTGKASKESDVFSFGVVLLEIATGRKSSDQTTETGLVEWVWDLYGEGKFLLATDEKLNRDLDEKQAECLMIVGLWCAHPDSRSRPCIKQAIQVLNFETDIPNLPTKMPVPLFHVPSVSFITKGPIVNDSRTESGA